MTTPRDSPSAVRDTSVSLGEWTVHPALDRLERGGEEVRLEPKVMEVLVYLLRRPDQVVSKEELLRAVWPDTFVEEVAVSRCVSVIRKALGDDPKAPRFIETVPKRGYRLLAAPPPSDEESASSASEAQREGRRGRAPLWLAGGAVAAIVAGIWMVRGPEPSVEPGPAAGVTPAPAATLDRARSYYERHEAAGNANAVELFKAALEEDPESAAAYAGLAKAYADGVTHFGLARRWLTAAIDSGRRAVELAPSSAEAHHAASRALLAADRWGEARASGERAVELQPGLAEAWLDLARIHALSGHLDEAVRAQRRVSELEPASAQLEADRAVVLRLLGAPEAAARAAERALGLEPFEAAARWVEARLALERGELVTARDRVRAYREVVPDDPEILDLAGLVEHAAGNTAAAESFFQRAADAGFDWGQLHRVAAAGGASMEGATTTLETLEERARVELAEGTEHWLPHLLLAGVAAQRGEREVAVDALGAAVAAGFRDLSWVSTDPALAPLASDAGFLRWRADLESRIADMRRRIEPL